MVGSNNGVKSGEELGWGVGGSAAFDIDGDTEGTAAHAKLDVERHPGDR